MSRKEAFTQALYKQKKFWGTFVPQKRQNLYTLGGLVKE